MAGSTVHDVVVVGAGAAGVSAAIECLDIRLDVAVMEAAAAVGGQIDEIPHDVRNVATAPDGNTALVAALTRHASSLGERLRLEHAVTSIDVEAGEVVAGRLRVHARTVLLATGSRRREMAVAPEGALGGDVTYLVEPRIEHFTGRPAVVVGGGDSAVLDALALAETGSAVTLMRRSAVLTARHDLVDRVRSDARITELAGWEIESLAGSERLDGVTVRSTSGGELRHLEVHRLVLKLGRAPCTELVRDQLRLGRRGGIVVDADLRTSHPRTFAAGDVVDGAYERVATAAGQGSLAARSVLRSLDPAR
jgi:thioredoxin reductase (NADPH)